MILEVKRIFKGNKYTIGKLYIDGEYFCDTMEPPVRLIKPKAIPLGKYKVIINHSNKFNKQLPLLLNVEGFEGIRIHNGSYPEDSLGCILVGRNKTSKGHPLQKQGMLIDSRYTLMQLMNKLKDVKDINITIE